MKISAVRFSLIVAIATVVSTASGAFGAASPPRPTSCLSKEQSCCIVKTGNCCCPASQNDSRSSRFGDAKLDPKSADSKAIGSNLSSSVVCSCRLQIPADDMNKPTRSDSTPRRTPTDRIGSPDVSVRPACIHAYHFRPSPRVPLLGSLPEPFLRSTHLLI